MNSWPLGCSGCGRAATGRAAGSCIDLRQRGELAGQAQAVLKVSRERVVLEVQHCQGRQRAAGRASTRRKRELDCSPAAWRHGARVQLARSEAMRPDASLTHRSVSDGSGPRACHTLQGIAREIKGPQSREASTRGRLLP